MMAIFDRSPGSSVLISHIRSSDNSHKPGFKLFLHTIPPLLFLYLHVVVLNLSSILFNCKLTVCLNPKDQTRPANSLTVVSLMSPFIFPMITFISGLHSSTSTCRHTPHGVHGPSVSATMAIAWKLPASWPSAIARNNAVRSAQLVGPYAAFSTLHPRCTSPRESSRAPTQMLNRVCKLAYVL